MNEEYRRLIRRVMSMGTMPTKSVRLVFGPKSKTSWQISALSAKYDVSEREVVEWAVDVLFQVGVEGER